MSHIICHACGEPGHKSNHCAVARRLAAEAIMRGQEPPQLDDAEEAAPGATAAPNLPTPPPTYTCFMCNQKGHFIRHCPLQPNNIAAAQAAAAKAAAPPPQAAASDANKLLINVIGQPYDLNPAIPQQGGNLGAVLPEANTEAQQPAAYIPFGKRPMEFVTCFKCRGKGHYANKCPFGNPQAGIPRSAFNPGQQQMGTTADGKVVPNMQLAVNQQMHHLMATGPRMVHDGPRMPFNPSDANTVPIGLGPGQAFPTQQIPIQQPS